MNVFFCYSLFSVLYTPWTLLDKFSLQWKYSDFGKKIFSEFMIYILMVSEFQGVVCLFVCFRLELSFRFDVLVKWPVYFLYFLFKNWNSHFSFIHCATMNYLWAFVYDSRYTNKIQYFVAYKKHTSITKTDTILVWKDGEKSSNQMVPIKKLWLPS